MSASAYEKQKNRNKELLSKGKTVMAGDSVQLRHLRSGKYITLSKDQQGLEVLLEEESERA